MTKQRIGLDKIAVLYKFLESGSRSELDNNKWGIGCSASKRLLDAYASNRGAVLVIVEGWGKFNDEPNKMAFAEMQIVRAFKWSRRDNQDLAIYCAGLVLPIYEKKYPAETRARNCFEATRQCLKNPTAENFDLLEASRFSVWNFGASDWANRAVWDAAGTVWDAARATNGKAWEASWAGWVVFAVRHVTANPFIITIINDWMENRINGLEEMRL